jgi:arsenate reductase
MTDTTIYHNPRCSKSRQALALLEEAGKAPNVVKYLDTPLDVPALDALCTRLGLEPHELMRTGEDAYAALGFKGRTPGRAEALEALAAHPILMERPVVVRGDKAVVARPPERVNELF